MHLYFATLLAAVVHDFKHPGRNNIFLAAVSDDEAIRFSDDSVNERMHLAEVFKMTTYDEGCNIFHALAPAQVR